MHGSGLRSRSIGDVLAPGPRLQGGWRSPLVSGYERPITISPSRKDDPVATRPDAGPLLRLEVMTCGILGKYGLRVEEAETMCPPFSGCDIAPCRGM